MVEPGTFIFFFSLLACIPLGSLYKQILDEEKKRNFGTGVGILIAIAISGPYIHYSILLVLGNILIIRYCDRRTVHQASLFFTWLFLLYVHIKVDCSKYATWLIQTLALRLVGLAFELNIYVKNKNREDKKPAAAQPNDDEYSAIEKLSVVDIISYAYFFAGLHKGPYYTWKTFKDHFRSLNQSIAISEQGEFRMITLQKLERAIFLSLVYFLIRVKYPLSIYEERDFYVIYGADYRYLSCMPQLVLYFIEYRILLLVSTSMCTEAGFGLYPAKSLPIPAAGPTVPVTLDASTSAEEFNFSMLKCFDNEKIFMGPKMKDTLRGWDMSTRYWFSEYIVKNLIRSNFEVRSACSFMFWTIWVGPSIQNIIIASTLWVYLHLEAEYAQMYAEWLRCPWDLGFSIMRLFCLFYLTPCLIIDDRDTVLRYYNSIYWVYHIILALLILLAVGLQRSESLLTFGQSLNLPSKLGSIMLRFTRESSNTGTPSTSGNSCRVCLETE